MPKAGTKASRRTKLVYRRPHLYPKQLAAIFEPRDHGGQPARYGVIEASTKSGKTVGCMVWLAEQAMRGRPGWNYWWLAPVASQAEIAFRRLMRGLPRHLHVANRSRLTLTLANGAVIWFKTAEKPDSLYGEDVHAAVIDEASRCRVESWHALRSTLTATRGPVRIIGNVSGRRNWAYRLARRAEAGEPGMAYARITAHDAVAAGVLDAAEIEDAKRQLPEGVFRELYLAEASDDDANPFGLAAIRACVAPMSMEPAAAWGWDLAKRVDWTVGVALDGAARVCGFERFQVPWVETKARILTATQAPALVDSTGVGDPVLEDLQRAVGARFAGFTFHQASKQQLMERLALAIQEQRIRFPKGPIVSELENFEFEYGRTGVRYTAPPGLHDDCVMALALALNLLTRPARDIRVRQL